MAYIKDERYDEQTTAAIAQHYKEILRLLKLRPYILFEIIPRRVDCIEKPDIYLALELVSCLVGNQRKNQPFKQGHVMACRMREKYRSCNQQ